MKRVYFGTDGVRGPCGGPLINERFAARLGLAVARWVKARENADVASGSPATTAPAAPAAAPSSTAAEATVAATDLVLIGRDTRGSGPALENALAAGLRAGGLRPVSLGVLPTPAVARAVARRGAVLGVVVTASHNPSGDNGIKFFAPGGLKLSDAEEAAIEALLPAESEPLLPAPPASASVPPLSAAADFATNLVAAPALSATSTPAPALSPTTTPLGDAAQDYVGALAALVPAGGLAAWRIVVDTANGATCATTPAALRALGAEVHVIGGEPDGLNINAGVGSEHPESLAREVVARGARLGIAHDGDGDRCVLCDETGALLDGDEILAILALDALRRGALAADTLVVTVQSNLGLDSAIRAAGGRVERTDVGDRYVLERLRALGARLGGESSGHIINLDLSPTGDGLAAALGILAIMQAGGRPLSELRRALRKFPQGTRNLRVSTKRPLAECPALLGELRVLETTLGNDGRVMARFSGTESKLRLLAEAREASQVGAALERLEAAARRDLAVL